MWKCPKCGREFKNTEQDHFCEIDTELMPAAGPEEERIPPQEYEEASAEAVARAYDSEAEATGWRGPEIAFAMLQERILPGQAVVDLGIGTGLAAERFREAGAVVHGLDMSQEMLNASRWKGFEHLTLYDLTTIPYPYPSESFDHAICIGVLSFIPDPSPVFAETSRILKPGGMFVFVTGDRTETEPSEFPVGPEHTGCDEPVTMYRHSAGQVREWLDGSGLLLLESRPFLAYMDRSKTDSMPVHCYAARKV